MIDIEKENPSLKGVLPKDYARPALDKTRLGEVIDLFSFKIGDEESRSKDVLGRVYEYFLSKFASAEGKNGGEFYTPNSVVQLLVAMIEPFKGRVYDHAVALVGCSFKARSSLRNIKVGLVILRYMDRSRTRPPGSCAR